MFLVIIFLFSANALAQQKKSAAKKATLTTTTTTAIGHLSEKQTQFLINELARTIDILSQEPMVPPPNAFPAMLDKNKLVSWFDLERPEPQGIYYRVLGLPIQNQSLLSRTKSEFFQMSQEEREKLKIALQPVLKNLQQQLPKKSLAEKRLTAHEEWKKQLNDGLRKICEEWEKRH